MVQIPECPPNTTLILWCFLSRNNRGLTKEYAPIKKRKTRPLYYVNVLRVLTYHNNGLCICCERQSFILKHELSSCLYLLKVITFRRFQVISSSCIAEGTTLIQGPFCKHVWFYGCPYCLLGNDWLWCENTIKTFCCC